MAEGRVSRRLAAVLATDMVGLFAVDLCSGMRTEGALDEGKLGRFVAAAT